MVPDPTNTADRDDHNAAHTPDAIHAPEGRTRRRPPWTICGMLTAELIRLLLISSAGLVVVIAFGLAMQPLAEGLIGVGDAVWFAALLTIPMLQFAMPFAAGFSSTLVYHRFAADRESIACSASGIPYRSLVMPVLLLGVILAAGMFALGAHIIPRFLRSAESIIARDAASLVIAPLRLGRAVRIGDLDIRAGEVVPLGPDPLRGATQHLALFDVFAARVTPEGDATMFVSAQRVDLWVYEEEAIPSAAEGGSAVAITDEGFVGARTAVAILQLAFTNATGRMPDGALSGETLVLNPIRVPTKLSDDVKYLTWSALDRALEEPRRLAPVDRRARWLAAALSEQGAVDAFNDALASTGTITLDRFDNAWIELGVFDPASRPIPGALTLEPIGAEPGRFAIVRANPTDRIGIRWFEDGQLRRVQQAADGELILTAMDPLTGEPAGFVDVRIRLLSVRTLSGTNPDTLPAGPTAGSGGAASAAGAGGVGGVGGGERLELRITGLRARADPSTAIMREPADALLRRADAAISRSLPTNTNPNPTTAHTIAPHAALEAEIIRTRQILTERIDELRAEAFSMRHELAALSAVACIMIALGAVMALRHAAALPLAAYLWSFLPALAVVILISTGERLTARHGPPGLLMLWGGVIALALYTITELRRVGKH
ncbi:MAG: LptF/LptG family permease [Phycisphaerales bacterium]